ncbi:MAG: D-TA family PLP-dependent enzyme [bacterium]
MHFTELDTPSLLVDLDRLESNLLRMAELAHHHNVKLRPHTKTHKCPEIARLQLEYGASGITCAKLGEAEVMAKAGLDDILIANEIIGVQKVERLLQLSRKAKVSVAVDSEYGTRSLNSALEQANQTLEVVIEINSGQDRSGVLPGEEAVALAKTITQLECLQLRGLMTHAGQAYHETSEAGLKKVGLHEGTVMVETAELLRQNGIDVEEISVGSTPAAPYSASVEGVTEIRPGTYVFGDLTQVDLFSCTLKDCALTVLATVTSRPTSTRAIVDAGRKTLTSDPASHSQRSKGFGLIPARNTVISRLSEEHGVIESESEFEIGEKVQIVPNHACVVVNMFDEMVGVRNGEVEKVFKIAARGKIR